MNTEQQTATERCEIELQKRAVRQQIALLQIIAEAVWEAGSIPSGHLYAAMVGKVTLSAFESLVAQLCRTGLIRQNGYVLTWTGPCKGKPGLHHGAEEACPDCQ